MGESQLGVLNAACEALLSSPESNDFWLISALTDWSFEEGDRNVHFRDALRTYAEAGVDPLLLDPAARGLNGNLRLALEREISPRPVLQNPNRGQDLEFAGARAEVKLLYDSTLAKYYGAVAADWEKLAEVRNGGFDGPLFLVVFFVELPGRTYFRGRRKTVHRGIEQQFEELLRELPIRPTWPEDGPAKHRLSLPEAELAGAIERRFDQVNRTSGWFRLVDQMRDAAVAACVWQYRD